MGHLPGKKKCCYAATKIGHNYIFKLQLSAEDVLPARVSKNYGTLILLPPFQMLQEMLEEGEGLPPIIPIQIEIESRPLVVHIARGGRTALGCKKCWPKNHQLR